MIEKKQKFKLLAFGQVNPQLRFMKGKLLTLIDATISDEQQNKATKDIIHQIVGETINTFWRYSIGEDVFPEKEEN